LGRKWILAAVGLPVLVAMWWAFRPEKLWVNEKVNEPAPFASAAEPQPLFTGRFEGKTQQTSGRATIYKKPGGEEYLRLSDFASPNGEDVHVALVRGGDRIDLGALKNNQSDQNYDLPRATDLNKYDAVVVYSEQSHTVIGRAKLEPF
jgi:hypothetical protein